MKPAVLLDTGPLVALLNRRDVHHRWAIAQWGQVPPPLLTCEAVITEACYLLRRAPPAAGAVMELLDRGIVKIGFRVEEHTKPLSRLLARYASVPMSLADACLVRMTELYGDSVVLTLDSDFRLYRKHGRQMVPVIMPDAGS